MVFTIIGKLDRGELDPEHTTGTYLFLREACSTIQTRRSVAPRLLLQIFVLYLVTVAIEPPCEPLPCPFLADFWVVDKRIHLNTAAVEYGWWRRGVSPGLFHGVGQLFKGAWWGVHVRLWWHLRRLLEVRSRRSHLSGHRWSRQSGWARTWRSATVHRVAVVTVAIWWGAIETRSVRLRTRKQAGI